MIKSSYDFFIFVCGPFIQKGIHPCYSIHKKGDKGWSSTSSSSCSSQSLWSRSSVCSGQRSVIPSARSTARCEKWAERTKETVSIDTASFVFKVEPAHAQMRSVNWNIPHRGDFPTLIVNNLVNDKVLRGIEFLDKIRILGASLRVVLSHKEIFT